MQKPGFVRDGRLEYPITDTDGPRPSEGMTMHLRWMSVVLPLLPLVAILAADAADGEQGADPRTTQELQGYDAIAALRRVYIIAPGGDDAGPGTMAKPFRTIARAAALLQPGEGAFVQAGVYRERVAPARGGTEGSPIVYCAERGFRTIIKGSDLWTPAWRREEGADTWSAKPDDALFTDDAYWDSANPLRVMLCVTPEKRLGLAEYDYFQAILANPRSAPDRIATAKRDLKNCDRSLRYTLGQVFIDGALCKQVGLAAELPALAGSWRFDAEAGRVIVHFPAGKTPERCQVELTTRRRIFAPHERGLGFIQVHGFVMEHCGNQYPKDFWSDRLNAQAGALGTRSGNHWTITGNWIRFANCAGLDVGEVGVEAERGDAERRVRSRSGSHVIENNYITDNGAIGIMGYNAHGLVVRGNILERNGHLILTGFKRYEGAAIKFHAPNGTIVEGNLIRGNQTNGVWFDGGFGKHAAIRRNLIVDNDEHGIFIEMGVYPADTGFIVANILAGNRNGCYCHDGSGVTYLNNLIMGSKLHGVQIHQVGPRCNTKNHALFNNLLVGNANPMLINYPKELGGGTRLDGNAYAVPTDQRGFIISKHAKYNPAWSREEFQAMVLQDLGLTAVPPGMPDPEGRGSTLFLRFAEWQTFWKRHAEECDAHSVVDAGLTAVFDAARLDVTLTVPASVMTMPTRSHTALTLDYLGTAIPASGAPRPGPFQNLAPGRNQFHVWHGIPVVPPVAAP